MKLKIRLRIFLLILLCLLLRPVQAQFSFPGTGPTNVPLDSWTFYDHYGWTSDNGYAPISFTNIGFSRLGDGDSLVVDTNIPAWLNYYVYESNGTNELTVNSGTVAFWFLCYCGKKENENEAQVWLIREVLEYEPTLLPFIDAPAGTKFRRTHANSTWQKESICFGLQNSMKPDKKGARSELSWKTRQIASNGFPLFLRYPAILDFDDFKNAFPLLVAITHELSKVNGNGVPETDYNDALFDFDRDIRAVFEEREHGQTVLIETYCGKRIYYIYVSEEAGVSEKISIISKRYPAERLSWSARPDSEWTFIKRYTEKFNLMA
jgi:hypothetical protein